MPFKITPRRQAPDVAPVLLVAGGASMIFAGSRARMSAAKTGRITG
jgi:hypothetical protein